jgi:ATP-dependent phosphoenolpyruvate carboxykinase
MSAEQRRIERMIQDRSGKVFQELISQFDKLDPERYEGRLRTLADGSTSRMVVVMDFDRRVGIVFGSSYMGAIKKLMVYPNGTFDFDDDRFTQNSRASYPPAYLSNVKPSSVAGHPQTVISRFFGVGVPASCPGVPAEILTPVNTWTSREAYRHNAAKLAGEFRAFRP